MKSIRRRFDNLQAKRPAVSSLLNFAGAIEGQKFTEGIVRRWFHQLVDLTDYDKRDKRLILEFLFFISTPEDDRKQG